MRGLRSLGLAGRPWGRTRELRKHPGPRPYRRAAPLRKPPGPWPRRRATARCKPPGRDDGAQAPDGAAAGQHRRAGVRRRPGPSGSATRQHGRLAPEAGRVLAQCRIRRCWRRPGPTQPQRYRQAGPDGRLIIALQTQVDIWEIAVRHGATAAAPSSSVPGLAGSEARGQSRWIGGVVWLDDLAGALAAARRAALLGFSGPPAGARGAELDLPGEVGGPSAWGRPLWLRRGPATARPGTGGGRLPRKRWWLIEGRE